MAKEVLSWSADDTSPSFIPHIPSVSPSINRAPISAANSSWNSSLSAFIFSAWRSVGSLSLDLFCPASPPMWYICAKMTGLVRPALVISCTRARWHPRRFWWLLMAITTTSGCFFSNVIYSSAGVPNWSTRNFKGASSEATKGRAVTGKMGNTCSTFLPAFNASAYTLKSTM